MGQLDAEAAPISTGRLRLGQQYGGDAYATDYAAIGTSASAAAS
ncbi:hypothetical protein [Actinoplanes sp. NPDC089786]